MKVIMFSVALLFSFGLWIDERSQDPQTPAMLRPFEHEDECGSPVRESSAWFTVDGKVIKVVDGDTVIVLTKDNTRKRVDLVAVDASAGQAGARSLLSELVLNLPVSVWVGNTESNPVVGVVHSGERDVNRELLAVGAVKYKQPKPYTMSNYRACVYRIVEREARTARKGLWENTSQ